MGDRSDAGTREHAPARVRLEEFDPRWAERYEAEARSLRDVLGADLVAVEHVGSTSIPGMPAKPIIDIVADISNHADFADVIHRLGRIGYRYDPAAERDDPGRRVFRKGPDDETALRTHHLHVTPEHGPDWRRLTAFRDHLRRHPADAAAYVELKRALAARFAGESRRYTAGKTEFVTAIERKAGVGS